MIVISGALVLVALVLLVIGVLAQELSFVYASIGVCLVALVLLVIGVYQRRGQTSPETDADADDSTVRGPAPGTRSPSPRATELLVRGSSASGSSVPGSSAPSAPVGTGAAAASSSDGRESEDARPAGDGTEPGQARSVVVVVGRPRYHVEGCRYLAGKQTQQREVPAARAEGFSPCGVCKPDSVPGAPARAARPDGVTMRGRQAERPPPVPSGAKRPRPATRAADSTGRSSARPVDHVTSRMVRAEPGVPEGTAADAGAAPESDVSSNADRATRTEPTRTEPTRTEPTLTDPAVAGPGTQPPVTSAASGDADLDPARLRAAPAGDPDDPAEASADGLAPGPEVGSAALRTTEDQAERAGSVVVMPDRGRFHRAECRYVRGVDGAELLSRMAATRKGYDACGVCKP